MQQVEDWRKNWVITDNENYCPKACLSIDGIPINYYTDYLVGEKYNRESFEVDFLGYKFNCKATFTSKEFKVSRWKTKTKYVFNGFELTPIINVNHKKRVIFKSKEKHKSQEARFEFCKSLLKSNFGEPKEKKVDICLINSKYNTSSNEDVYVMYGNILFSDIVDHNVPSGGFIYRESPYTLSYEYFNNINPIDGEFWGAGYFKIYVDKFEISTSKPIYDYDDGGKIHLEIIPEMKDIRYYKYGCILEHEYTNYVIL